MAVAETAHKGEDNTFSGPAGRGVKNDLLQQIFMLHVNLKSQALRFQAVRSNLKLRTWATT